jgi:hypothetical protein
MPENPSAWGQALAECIGKYGNCGVGADAQGQIAWQHGEVVTNQSLATVT